MWVWEHICIRRAGINQRIHGGVFQGIELFGLGTPAENRYEALEAVESHFHVLVEDKKIVVGFETVEMTANAIADTD